MKEVTLTEYLDSYGTQPELAHAIGVTQSAVSQMVKSSRNIAVRIFDDGRLEAIELRVLNRLDKARAAKSCPTLSANVRPNLAGHQPTVGAGVLSSGAQASP